VLVADDVTPVVAPGTVAALLVAIDEVPDASDYGQFAEITAEPGPERIPGAGAADAARRALVTFGDPVNRAAAITLLDQLEREETR